MAAVVDLWLEQAHNFIGVPVAGVRLLLTTFMTFPVVLLHKRTISGRSANLQHVYFTLFGLLLVYFNFGMNMIHGMLNVVMVHLILKVLGGTASSVALCFILNLVYMLVCYAVTKTDGYDISWSIPQCVLTLRLTGLAWDVYDGRPSKEKLSADAEQSSLKTNPSLLETLGYCYFTPCFMVGPQFPMRRYQDFVNGRFAEKAGTSQCLQRAILRAAAGIVYICLYAVLTGYFSSDYLVSEDFKARSFVYKMLFILIWGQVLLQRYLGFWLLAESGCVMSGLAYNGTDKNGNDKWDACANIRITKFHMAVTFQDLVDSFNVNTNQWMLKYIYKRLRFLGNRHISQSVTLAYLAIWHGYHSGYFMNFFLEFPMISCEKDVHSFLERRVALKKAISSWPLRLLLTACSKFVVTLSLSYALVSFDLLHFGIYMQVYHSVYYILHIVFLSWPLLHILLKYVYPASAVPALDKEGKAQ